MSTIYNLSLNITSNSQTIALTSTYTNITKMRVRTFKYTTASINNYNMLIAITNWTANNRYEDGVSGLTYTKLIVLPPITSTTVICDFGLTGIWDQESTTPLTFNSLVFTISINGVTTTDITPSNPVILELALQ